MKKKTFTFFTDAGHGWLSVSHKDVIDVGIQDKITAYSPMTLSRIFLEEDCDMPAFLSAYTKKYGEGSYTLKSSYKDNSHVRSIATGDRKYIGYKLKIGDILKQNDGLEMVVIRPKQGNKIIVSYNGKNWSIPLSNPFNYFHEIIPKETVLQKIEEKAG